jgi:hypothetical protein
MPLVGVCGVVVGVFGDKHGWWDSRSFLTNLLSSLTGLFFGVPFALMVLTRLSGAQADLIEQRAVRRLAERATENFNAELIEFRQTAPLRGDSSSLKELAREWKESIATAERMCRSALMQPDAGQPRAQLAMEDAATAIDAAMSLRPFADNLRVRDLEPILRVLKVQWTELDREVRVRAAEVGLDWVSHSYRAAVADALRENLFLHFTSIDQTLRNDADIFRRLDEFLDDGNYERKAADALWAAVTAPDEIRSFVGVPLLRHHP